MAKKQSPEDLTPEQIAELQALASSALKSLNTRIPASLHADLKRAADQKGVTLQDYVTDTLTRSVARTLKK